MCVHIFRMQRALQQANEEKEPEETQITELGLKIENLENGITFVTMHKFIQVYTDINFYV